MKNKILEILKDKLHPMSDHLGLDSIDCEHSAVEIEAHVFEFIEWIAEMQNVIWWNSFLNLWVWHIVSEMGENESHYYTSELYNYWWTNIKEHESKKQT